MPPKKGSKRSTARSRKKSKEDEEARKAQEEAEKEEEEAEKKEPEKPEQWLVVAGGMDGPVLLSSTELLAASSIAIAEPQEEGADGTAAIASLIGGGGGADAAGAEEGAEPDSAGVRAFVPGPPLSGPRWGCTAVALGGPLVLIIGGFDGEGYLASTEVLDLKAWTCSPGPTMSLARAGCAAVTVDRRRVLVIGGYSHDTCEILDLEKMSFSPGPQLRQVRACAAAIMLDEHRLMVAGGFDRLGCCDSTEIMDLRKAPREDDWDEESPASLEKARFWPGPQLSRPRGNCAVTRMAAPGRVLFIGGFDGKDRLDSTEMLDLFNYNVPCTSRPPVLGEAVVSKGGGAVTAALYTKGLEQPPNEDEEDEDDEEGKPKRPKAWELEKGAEARVIGTFDPEEDDASDADSEAENGTFRLANPDGVESAWQSIADFAYPPTNQMVWSSGPSLCSPRSGAASVLLPTMQMGEQKPQLLVVGGFGQTPNEALASAEVLSVSEEVRFEPSIPLTTRRGLCAAAVVTVVGKLGPPEAEAEGQGGAAADGADGAAAAAGSRAGSKSVVRGPDAGGSRAGSKASATQEQQQRRQQQLQREAGAA